MPEIVGRGVSLSQMAARLNVVRYPLPYTDVHGNNRHGPRGAVQHQSKREQPREQASEHRRNVALAQRLDVNLLQKGGLREAEWVE